MDCNGGITKRCLNNMKVCHIKILLYDIKIGFVMRVNVMQTKSIYDIRAQDPLICSSIIFNIYFRVNKTSLLSHWSSVALRGKTLSLVAPTEYTECQRPFSSVHFIMMEKLAQPGVGGGGPYSLPYFYSTPICTLWLHHLHSIRGGGGG